MKKYGKLAVFGGTFSPVHNGHIKAMRVFYDAVMPDVMYVIPTASPPHKMRKDSATDAQRIDMLNIAVNQLGDGYNVVVSDIEIRRGGKSYTVDTVKALLEIADKVVIYCGTDMLLTLDEWHDYRQLLSIASVAYMQREDDRRFEDEVREKADFLRKDCGADIIELPTLCTDVSSSDIRDAVGKGKTIDELVPSGVAEYITENRLYR